LFLTNIILTNPEIFQIKPLIVIDPSEIRRIFDYKSFPPPPKFYRELEDVEEDVLEPIKKEPVRQEDL